jgi:methylmalonyl-CoA mutase N-terminal domain/subunit
MSDHKAKSSATAERRQRFATLSGLPVERLYSAASLRDWNQEEALGYPGEFPYTR